MPRQNDHPLVALRAQHGWGLTALSKASGVNRNTLIAIEEGRTRSLSQPVRNGLEAALSLPVGQLQRDVDAWFKGRSPRDQLTNRARAILSLPVTAIDGNYDTFKQWRQDIAPSITAFASLLGVNRGLVSEYEKGVRTGDMTVNLMHRIESALGVSHAYVVALAELEPS